MSTLYLIRHGQASFHDKNNYDKLSDKGILQSRVLAEYFNSIKLQFDAIYTGMQKRHLETAEELISLYKKSGITVPEVKRMEELNEYDFKNVLIKLLPIACEQDPNIASETGKMFTSDKSFQFVYEDIMLRWISGDYDLPDMVKWEDFVSRVNRGIDNIMKSDGQGKKIAVFTSGGPISVAVKKAINLSDTDTMRINWKTMNSSVTRFKCTHDRIMLTSFNEYPHLENYRDENLVTHR